MRLQKRYWGLTRKKKRKVKWCINEEFGRKIDQYIHRNGKMFWKELSKVNGRKARNCSRIENVNWRLSLGKDEVRRIWNNYLKNL